MHNLVATQGGLLNMSSVITPFAQCIDGFILDSSARHKYMLNIMTSSNGSILRVTVPLCGESTGHRWIPLA